MHSRSPVGPIAGVSGPDSVAWRVRTLLAGARLSRSRDTRVRSAGRALGAIGLGRLKPAERGEIERLQASAGVRGDAAARGALAFTLATRLLPSVCVVLGEGPPSTILYLRAALRLNGGGELREVPSKALDGGLAGVLAAVDPVDLAILGAARRADPDLLLERIGPGLTAAATVLVEGVGEPPRARAWRRLVHNPSVHDAIAIRGLGLAWVG